MKSRVITVIPVYNGQQFIGKTLQSVADQRLRPDRVIVLDNCSTDQTERVVKEFGALPCEWIRNSRNLGLFGNCNRALEFAPETAYLHILHADDLIAPEFYETLIRLLESCNGFGLAYCLDERIDEEDRTLSLSGRPNGRVRRFSSDAFLRKKAEIANQAFSGSVMKTSGREAPCRFRLDMPILADMAFWADWGQHCEAIVQVNLPLCRYRWHGDNTTNTNMPGLEALILDEWRVMQMNEQLREKPTSPVRKFKLKGLFAVRTGIKARRVRQQNNPSYANEIARTGRKISGPLAWAMAQVLVEIRDLVIYKLLRRRRHPKNVYS